MEDREMPRMRKDGESKTTRIILTTVRNMTSSSGLGKFQTNRLFSTECITSWGKNLRDNKG